MVAEIYSELQGVARELLTEFTQGTITYTAIARGAGPADEPGAAVPTDYPFEGVMRGVKQKYVDNSTVFVTDMQVTMPGNIVEPDASGFVSAGGQRYKIVQIDRKPALGPAAVFVLIMRK